nr:MAG TPA: minor capsid protein [Caudoviricetes sp.]
MLIQIVNTILAEVAIVTIETKYWTKRRELEDQARLKQENQTLKKLTSVFPEALKEIQEKLLSQADLHDITYAEMMEFYSKSDQKKYREYVEKNYKSLKMYDSKYKEFIDEFFPSFDYAKINRLLQIRSDIFKILAYHAIDVDVNKYFSDRLEEILQRSYASNANVLSQLLNVDLPNYLSQVELESYLNYPWSGKTFSRRLWGNISSLEQKLSNAIVKSVASGEGVIHALNTMRTDSEICDMFKLEESKYNKAIENLVRTEYAKFAQDGIEKSYLETGIEEYNVLTAKDERVCRICGGKASKNPYKLKDAVIGENRAPFHSRCRCTDVPNLPKLGKDIDEEYDRLFGDLLDEFAHDSFGINLKRRK